MLLECLTLQNFLEEEATWSKGAKPQDVYKRQDRSLAFFHTFDQTVCVNGGKFFVAGRPGNILIGSVIGLHSSLQLQGIAHMGFIFAIGGRNGDAGHLDFLLATLRHDFYLTGRLNGISNCLNGNLAFFQCTDIAIGYSGNVFIGADPDVYKRQE